MTRPVQHWRNLICITRTCGAICLALFLCSCASIRVGSDYDRSVTFAGYRTFAWLPREHHGSRNPLTAERTHDAIEGELARKGFVAVKDPAAADFIMDFTIGASDRMDVQSYPEPYHGPYWTYPGWWRPYWGSTLDVRTYREGTLSIDVFDAHTHRPIWHGWATKEITPSDLANSESRIRSAVKRVLSTFPPH